MDSGLVVENGPWISFRHPSFITLDSFPECLTFLKEPIQSYQRDAEDIPPTEPEVTEHTLYGYWCCKCKKIVYSKVTDALPNAMTGLTKYCKYITKTKTPKGSSRD